MARNPYVRVELFERVPTRLNDCKVVGQSDKYLILERPAVKPRAAAKAAVKRNRASKPSPIPHKIASGIDTNPMAV